MAGKNLKVGQKVTIGLTLEPPHSKIIFAPVVPEHFNLLHVREKKIDGRVKCEVTLRATKPGDCEVKVRMKAGESSKLLGSASYPFSIIPRRSLGSRIRAFFARPTVG
jgi:hypothetical protein